MHLYRVRPSGADDGSRAQYAVCPEGSFVAVEDPFGAGVPEEPPSPESARRLESPEILAPVAPSKVVCLGRTYRRHADELNNDVPEQPLIFMKPPSAVIGPDRPIVLPPESEDVQHEAELALVVGERLRRADRGEARRGLLGYTCLNDVTARDLQSEDRTFFRGKSFDSFCPVGPSIATVDEVDLESARVRCQVDGELRQDAPIERLRIGALEALVLVSRYVTLYPGDVVATGTPEGVGRIRPGETVSVEVDGVGELINPAVRR